MNKESETVMLDNEQKVVVRFVDSDDLGYIQNHYMYDLHYGVYVDDSLIKESDHLMPDSSRYNPYLVSESFDDTNQNVADKIASYYGPSVDGMGDTVILMPYDDHIKDSIPAIAHYVQNKIISDNEKFVVEHDVEILEELTGKINMENKQPEFGDVLPNNPGNDGYGFEEHEHFVSSDSPKLAQSITSVNGNQPLFGDVLPNIQGNNGYGFEEHEQYLQSNEALKNTPKYIAPMPKPLDLVNDKVICIKAGSDRSKLNEIANDWHMTILGTEFFDDGEDMTPEHIDEVTAVYYENSIPNKSSSFIKAVQKELPNVFIATEIDYYPDFGDDVSRFRDSDFDVDEPKFVVNKSDLPTLDFSGLTNDGLEM